MSDLKVDYLTLRTVERSLSSLKQEFDDVGGTTDHSVGVWSHEKVKTAMDGFASNMELNCRKLSERLDYCHKQVTQTLGAFEKADSDLAKELDSEYANGATAGNRGPQ